MTGFVAVLLYVVWMQLLALSYAFPRVFIALSGKRRLDAWERTEVNTDPGVMVRAKGAHLNCVENFALFAGVVVVAALMGKSAVVDQVAGFILLARIGQSVTHIIGTAAPLMLIRAVFYLSQIGMMFWACWQLLR